MSEEEIIKIISDDIIGYQVGYEEYEEAVKGLLDLYNKEKEQNSLIKEKLKELNIPMETLIGEFNRLEDLEDDREQLKWRLKEERKKNKELTKKYKYAKEMYIVKYNSLEDYKDKIREIISVIRNRNYNDYTSAQDGNEVKEEIMCDIQELLEE